MIRQKMIRKNSSRERSLPQTNGVIGVGQ